MPEAAIKDQIKNLIELQAIDLQVYQLRREKQEKPQYIAELQATFEEEKAQLKALEGRLTELQLRRKEKEIELATKEATIKKSQGQLLQLKTNKEYQAMMLEIEGFNADKSVIEEVILGFFDETDTVKSQVETEKKRLVGEEQKFNQQKKEVDERIKAIDEQLHQLEARRTQFTPAIDKKILSRYERILVNRDGLALVAVKDGACQGCFMNTPPQVINEIKMKDKIIICEVCSRILYIEGEF